MATPQAWAQAIMGYICLQEIKRADTIIHNRKGGPEDMQVPGHKGDQPTLLNEARNVSKINII